VYLLFEREPSGLDEKQKLLSFITHLNKQLSGDLFYSFLIKCFCRDASAITSEHIGKCRKWVEREIDTVQPYLIIMMGKLPTAAIMGGKMLSLLQEGVFYIKKNSKGAKTQCFYGCDIDASDVRLEKVSKHLSNFIKEFYNG
jgi:uracil-DNA glycosylase